MNSNMRKKVLTLKRLAVTSYTQHKERGKKEGKGLNHGEK